MRERKFSISIPAGLWIGILVVLALVLLLPGCVSASRDAAPEPALPVAGLPGEEALRSVSIVFAADGGMGAAFHISPHLVVTAAHVIAGRDTATVVEIDGAQSAAVVLSRDVQLDVALLRLLSPAFHSHSAEIDCRAPRWGEPVLVVGHPFGLFWTGTRGHVASLGAGPMTGLRVVLDVPINPGNSGGPVFSVGGRVLGVAVSHIAQRRDNQSGLGAMTPASAFCDWLGRQEEKEGSRHSN